MCAGVPSFSIIVIRGWTATLRKELPRWRNILGLVSAVAPLVFWHVVLTSTFSGRVSNRGLDDFELATLDAMPWMCLVGAMLSFVWRGKPRFHALVANASLLLLQFASMIY